MCGSRTLVLLAFVLVAASSRAETVRSSSPDAPVQKIVVGNERGLSEIRPDGRVERVLSKAAAMRPRLLPDGKGVVFLRRVGRKIEVVSLADGAERTVAELPGQVKHCRDSGEGSSIALDEMSVQNDGGFVLDAAGKTACLHLRDRTDPFSERDPVLVDFRVDLSSGGVRQRSAPSCAGDISASPACELGCELS